MKNNYLNLLVENSKKESKVIEITNFIKDYVMHMGYPDNAPRLIDDLAEKVCKTDDCYEHFKVSFDIETEDGDRVESDETILTYKYNGDQFMVINCIPEYEECTVVELSSDILLKLIGDNMP